MKREQTMKHEQTVKRGFAIVLLLLGLAVHVPRATAATNEAQEAQTANAEALARENPSFRRALDWLGAINNMTGEFFQISSDGTQDAGTIAMLRPNRVRLDYASQPIILLADGINWVLYDHEQETKGEVLLSSSPLSFLLADEPDLSRIHVSAIAAESAILEITLNDSEHPEAGTLTLEFTQAPFALHGWRVRDAQGTHTRITLVNPRWNAEGEAAPPRSLFRNDQFKVRTVPER